MDSKKQDKNIKEFGTLGEYLKYAREKKGYTIDDVVSEIRVRKIYLEALENNDHQSLPERTYALGYLRAYANFLELPNLKELIEYLDNAYNFYNPNYSGEKGEFGSAYAGLPKAKPYVEKATNMAAGVDQPKFGPRESKLKVGLSGSALFSNKIALLSFLGGGVFLITLWLGVKLFVEEPASNVESSEDKIVQEVNQVIDDREFVLVDTKKDAPQSTATAVKDENNLNTANNDAVAIEANKVNDKPADNGVNGVDATKVEANKVDTVQVEAPKKANDDAVLKRGLVPFPKETIERTISLVFVEDVWVQIVSSNNPNVVYFERVFKAGQSYNVPGVVDINMNVGNYKGLYFLVEGERLDLTSNRNSLVINGIKLNKDALLSNYSAGKEE